MVLIPVETGLVVGSRYRTEFDYGVPVNGTDWLI